MIIKLSTARLLVKNLQQTLYWRTNSTTQRYCKYTQCQIMSEIKWH